MANLLLATVNFKLCNCIINNECYIHILTLIWVLKLYLIVENSLFNVHSAMKLVSEAAKIP